MRHLQARAGEEHQVQLYRNAKPLSSPEGDGYLLTCRGQQIEATGPSGATRWLSFARFQEIFAHSQFESPHPTGRLTDLGPLFEH